MGFSIHSLARWVKKKGTQINADFQDQDKNVFRRLSAQICVSLNKKDFYNWP
jgi:hypothetical protein